MTSVTVSSMSYDVAVVGGSFGGCSTALFFAQKGLRVVVIEREQREGAYKKLCTHFIQPSALPALRRIGLSEEIEKAGGLRNYLDVWTSWGWIRDEARTGAHGYNIRRQTLDPMLRRLTAGKDGIDFLSGHSARHLIMENDRIAGVLVRDPVGDAKVIRARLVVAADGRNSRLADLAAVPQKLRRNRRFMYFTYYRNLPLRHRAVSQYWHLTPNLAYAFRNDDDTTLLGVFLPHCELPAWKADLEESFAEFWRRVPDGPHLPAAERISEMLGMLEMPNLRRRAAWRGMALVGDAALALDPIWGTGCAFAAEAAEWLADETAEPLRANADPHELDRALARYERKHLSETRGHELHIADFSKVRGDRLFESLLLSGATSDGTLARQVLAYFGREIGFTDVTRPRNFLRAFRANLPRWSRALLESGRPIPE